MYQRPAAGLTNTTELKSTTDHTSSGLAADLMIEMNDVQRNFRPSLQQKQQGDAVRPAAHADGPPAVGNLNRGK